MKRNIFKLLLLSVSIFLYSCSSNENKDPKERFEDIKEERCKSEKCEKNDNDKDPKERFEDLKDNYCDKEECQE